MDVTRGPSIDKRINKLSFHKKAQRNLKFVLLSKRSLSEKICTVQSTIGHSERGTTMATVKRPEAAGRRGEEVEPRTPGQ